MGITTGPRGRGRRHRRRWWSAFRASLISISISTSDRGYNRHGNLPVYHVLCRCCSHRLAHNTGIGGDRFVESDVFPATILLLGNHPRGVQGRHIHWCVHVERCALAITLFKLHFKGGCSITGTGTGTGTSALHAGLGISVRLGWSDKCCLWCSERRSECWLPGRG